MKTKVIVIFAAASLLAGGIIAHKKTGECPLKKLGASEWHSKK